MDFPMNAPHEHFAALYDANPTAFDYDLDESAGNLPPTFWKHPVYQAKKQQAYPVGYFSDAVPHTKKDSFIVFYWSCLLGDTKRHMICSVRKADLCKCGCKGFCTLGAILRMIAWSFNALAS
eukprot:6689665-Alexandrium_andersonii.AAC.1